MDQVGNSRTPNGIRYGIWLGVMLLAASAAQGQVRLSVPEDSPGGPFYARFEEGKVYSSDGWIAIPFYRNPACVPREFNLLAFFDFANITAIFSCPLTVEGFELWRDPATDAGPKQSKLHGAGAVPIWFISVEDYQAALEATPDGITMEELLSMPSLLQGVATFFEETLHPLVPGRQTSLEIVARGLLPDGRAFTYVFITTADQLRHLSIVFR